MFTCINVDQILTDHQEITLSLNFFIFFQAHTLLITTLFLFYSCFLLFFLPLAFFSDSSFFMEISISPNFSAFLFSPNFYSCLPFLFSLLILVFRVVGFLGNLRQLEVSFSPKYVFSFTNYHFFVFVSYSSFQLWPYFSVIAFNFCTSIHLD